MPELVPEAAAAGRGRRRPEDVVAVAARLLAVRGRAAIPDVLGLAAEAVRAATVTVRAPRPPGRVIATYPQRPVGASAAASSVLDVPVRAGDHLYGVLTACAQAPFTASAAGALCGVADVLALALAVASHDDAPAQALLDAEADRADVAAQLHDTVGQALVAARYSAELALTGRGDPQAVTDGLQAALVSLRGCLRGLRSRAVDGRLGSLLSELAGDYASRRAAGDGDVPVVRLRGVDHPAVETLPAPVAVLAHRVVEAALAGVTGHVTVSVTVRAHRLKLSVEGAENPSDAGALDRWTRRASALGGELVRVWNGVRLDVPTSGAEEGHGEGSHLRRSPDRPRRPAAVRPGGPGCGAR